MENLIIIFIVVFVILYLKNFFEEEQKNEKSKRNSKKRKKYDRNNKKYSNTAKKTTIVPDDKNSIELDFELKVSKNDNKSDKYKETEDLSLHNKNEKDAWEGNFWKALEPKKINKKLLIKYTDGDGNKTERIVDVQKFDENLYGGMLLGYCHLRDATRTFRFDRIREAVDMDTGEFISDIKEYLKLIYKQSPESSLKKLIDEYYETLRVLLYISKADGQFRKEEKIIVRDACRKLVNDDRLTDNMIDKLFSNIDVPTTHAFKLAVGKIAKKEKYNFDLISVAYRIVNTQKNIHPLEKEALEYLEKKLKK